MSPETLCDVISRGLGTQPLGVWSECAGSFGLAVLNGALMSVVGRAETRSRLKVADPGYIVDTQGTHLRTRLGPEMSIPIASVVMDSVGRLETFDFTVAPLSELVFHYRSLDRSWEAVARGAWSNTTLSFFAANRTLIDALPTPPGKRVSIADDMSGEGTFWVGDQSHEVRSTSYRFANGAVAVQFQSTEVKRQSLGAAPSRVSLLLEGESVELVEVHVPRCLHTWEVDLTGSGKPLPSA